jgi:hypothetical protein
MAQLAALHLMASSLGKHQCAPSTGLLMMSRLPSLGIERLPFKSVVVGGATSRGGTTASSGAGRFIAGLGDPNNRVIGHVGDIFQRLDGTAGATLYVKETGNDINTGWAAK